MTQFTIKWGMFSHTHTKDMLKSQASCHFRNSEMQFCFINSETTFKIVLLKWAEIQ